MFIPKLDLQFFSEPDVPEVDVPVVDEDIDDSLIIDDEEVEDVEPEDEELDEVPDDEDVPEEVTDEPEDDLTDRPRFDAKQQKEVDRIIKARLERQETSMLKGLRDVAGTDLEMEEVTSAARLWGLLKTNPELSNVIDRVIDHHLKNGTAKAPTETVSNSKEAELEVKEAVLDLKLQDKTFLKHSDKILEWAENEGFEINSAKSLKLAYMAWKGSQGKIVEATKKLQEQKRQATKKAVQKKATVQSGKSGKQKGKLDFTKMNDADILSSEGLSLFVED